MFDGLRPTDRTTRSKSTLLNWLSSGSSKKRVSMSLFGLLFTSTSLHLTYLIPNSLALLVNSSNPFPWARKSMKKIVISSSGSCSLATIHSLVACMQHTAEHSSLNLLGSRDPTHCMRAILLGLESSEGLTISPVVGPLAFMILSNSIEVITFLWR